MILAIDTGNTHTVIGCIDSDGEIGTGKSMSMQQA